MDLNGVGAFLKPKALAELGPLVEGDRYLGGGTWLFSEPQPGTRRLIDLKALRWPDLAVTPAGLEIAGTCSIAALHRFDAPPAWTAAPLLKQCCKALLGSFKVWNAATVGGNLCMSLPAGPMISLTASLDAELRLCRPDGSARSLPMRDFVTGERQNALLPGEILRTILLPQASLLRRTGFRQLALNPLGRSGVVVIATLGEDFAVTVSAATRRPVQLRFPALPGAAELVEAIEAGIPASLYHDDIHGLPAWRKAMTLHLAEELRQELRP